MFGQRTKPTQWERKLALLACACALAGPAVSFTVQEALACNVLCYAGNIQAGYGAMANINAPSGGVVLPNVADSGTSSWVSTQGPTWMQSGWRFDLGDTQPRNYWEYCSYTGGACNYQSSPTNYGRFAWGETHNFIVEYDSRYGTLAWCAYIDSAQVMCTPYIQSVPINMQTMTEIHNSGLTPINTLFTYVSIKMSGGYYVGQDLAAFERMDFPYLAERTGAQSFRTYHAGVYIPLVRRG